jgi:hypothetical protein
MPQAEEAAESPQGLSTRNDGLADRRAGHLYNNASEVIREALRSMIEPDTGGQPAPNKGSPDDLFKSAR